MKPTQQEIIELAREAGYPDAILEFAPAAIERLVHLALERFGAGGGEPVGYLPAYELNRLQSGHDGRLRSAKFGPSALDGDVAVYTHPSPTALRAEYLRGLEDAKKASKGPTGGAQQSNEWWHGFRTARQQITDAIEALKGK